MINITRLIKYIIVVTILTTLFLFMNINEVEASSLMTNMTKDANKFVKTGSDNVGDIKYDKIAEQFTGLGKILTTIGAGVMVAVVTYMGIKYLTSGPEAQAKLKVQLIGVVVSGFVIFGAYTIWKVVVEIAEKF